MAPAANPAPAPAQRSRVGARSFRIQRNERKSGAETNAIRKGHTADVAPKSKCTLFCEGAENRVVAASIPMTEPSTGTRQARDGEDCEHSQARAIQFTN